MVNIVDRNRRLVHPLTLAIKYSKLKLNNMIANLLCRSINAFFPEHMYIKKNSAHCGCFHVVPNKIIMVYQNIEK